MGSGRHAVTVPIGGSCCPAASLVEFADRALYLPEGNGRNQVCEWAFFDVMGDLLDGALDPPRDHVGSPAVPVGGVGNLE